MYLLRILSNMNLPSLIASHMTKMHHEFMNMCLRVILQMHIYMYIHRYIYFYTYAEYNCVHTRVVSPYFITIPSQSHDYIQFELFTFLDAHQTKFIN